MYINIHTFIFIAVLLIVLSNMYCPFCANFFGIQKKFRGHFVKFGFMQNCKNEEIKLPYLCCVSRKLSLYRRRKLMCNHNVSYKKTHEINNCVVTILQLLFLDLGLGNV